RSLERPQPSGATTGLWKAKRVSQVNLSGMNGRRGLEGDPGPPGRRVQDNITSPRTNRKDQISGITSPRDERGEAGGGGTARGAATFPGDNGGRTASPPTPAGVLRLGPGPVRIEARFSRRFRAEDGWYTVLNCRLRIADAEGRLWQATSTFVSDCLL